jgi:hypothetical protein
MTNTSCPQRTAKEKSFCLSPFKKTTLNAALYKSQSYDGELQLKRYVCEKITTARVA